MLEGVLINVSIFDDEIPPKKQPSPTQIQEINPIIEEKPKNPLYEHSKKYHEPDLTVNLPIPVMKTHLRHEKVLEDPQEGSSQKDIKYKKPEQISEYEITVPENPLCTKVTIPLIHDIMSKPIIDNKTINEFSIKEPNIIEEPINQHTISKNADNKITKTKVPKLFKSDDGKIKRVIKAVDSLHTSVSEEKKYVGYCSNFLSRVTLYLLGS